MATFSANGDWDSIEQSGRVHFAEADRQASAARAKMVRATGLVNLEGSPLLSDSQSRTTAGSVRINQQSGEIQATGGVVSTYLAPPPGGNGAVNLGAGAAHISADALEGSASAGHVIYLGHARLWQAQSVLEAEQIEIWRDEKKLQAQGHIVAIFPQAPGTGASFAMTPTKSTVNPAKPTLWQIRAPALTYLSDSGKVHLDGGVRANSDEGSLESRTLDLSLSPAEPPGASAAAKPPTGPAGVLSGSGSRELSRVLAQGSVIVRQGDRRGAAEQAEYTAADQKFVLSGGQPTITDASSDTTTTGRSLTFYVASDTILIDSQEGLRTLTKHRVEK